MPDPQTHCSAPARTVLVALAFALPGLSVPLPAQTPVVAATATVEPVTQAPKLTPIEPQVSGRVVKATRTYSYQWPGTYFLLAYHGSDLYFHLGEGDQNLRIWVDGHTLAAFVKMPAGEYRIHNASLGTHAVRIDVINENQDCPKTIGEFGLTGDEHAIAFPAPVRQMEFIGDSHTVGYGNTSTSRECTQDQVWMTTDTSHSVPADTAIHYGASYQIDAISGHGVVRNYDGGAGDPVPVAYPYILFEKRTKYASETWHPNVIAVDLGTNDFATPLKPTEPWKTRAALDQNYEETFVTFLKGLRSRNPHALIVLWMTSLPNAEQMIEEHKVYEQMRAAGDTRIDFVPVTGLAYSGCHWHPSVADDRVISDQLILYIDKHKDVWEQAAAVQP